MPYRNQATIESWVADFLSEHDGAGPEITVLEQYFTEGPDSGLVVLQLRTASTVTSVVPSTDGVGAPTWHVQFDARDETLDLDADGVATLAADLLLLEKLCRYLQQRTDAARSGNPAA